MAVYDTVANQRSKYTRRTLKSVAETVDLGRHRMFVVDNGSCQETVDLINEFVKENPTVTYIRLEENLGTAEAINVAWKEAYPGESCIKMDNDVVIHQSGWVEKLEEAANRDAKIGQVGLKRKDCWENPDHKDPFYKSTLKMLSHEAGIPWVMVEVVNHVMGTCVLHTSGLLDTIGFMKQPGIYGFDDSLTSHRSRRAGFYNCFLPNIEIDHIDDGKSLYQKEKEQLANTDFPEYTRMINAYNDGSLPLYYNPFTK